MEIKAKYVIFLGAFIGLTLLGYFLMPKEEMIISTKEEQESLQEGNEQEVEETEERIYVHIEGAVSFPGVKEVAKGTRLFELIEMAGGETIDADIRQVNLASMVKDEQKIYIPFRKEESDDASTDERREASMEITESFENGRVNINQATVEELETLTGIGPSMAQKIVDYREEHGLFSSVEDIQQVSGIGSAKYEKMKEEITV